MVAVNNFHLELKIAEIIVECFYLDKPYRILRGLIDVTELFQFQSRNQMWQRCELLLVRGLFLRPLRTSRKSNVDILYGGEAALDFGVGYFPNLRFFKNTDEVSLNLSGLTLASKPYLFLFPWETQSCFRRWTKLAEFDFRVSGTSSAYFVHLRKHYHRQKKCPPPTWTSVRSSCLP